MSIELAQRVTLDIDNKLKSRGILDAAIQAGWQVYNRKGRDGWIMPLVDPLTAETVDYWFKDAESNYSQKYMPKGNTLSKHMGVQWYTPRPFALRAAIAENNGIAWVANGAPSVLAYQKAGIENVIAGRLENTVPSNVIEVCAVYGIKELRYPIDNDNVGMKAAISWRDALADTGIRFTACRWENTTPRYDANDAWIESDFSKALFFSKIFNAYRYNAIELPVRATQPRHTITTDFIHSESRQQMIDNIIISLKAQGYRGGDYWINGKCILPGHDDAQASAGIHIESGVYNCFCCGKFAPEIIAEHLGIERPTPKLPDDETRSGLYSSLRNALIKRGLSESAIVLDAYYMNRNAGNELLDIDAFIRACGQYGRSIGKKGLTYKKVYNAFSKTLEGRMADGVLMFDAPDTHCKWEVFSSPQPYASPLPKLFSSFFTLLESISIGAKKENSENTGTTEAIKPKKQYYIPTQPELAHALGIEPINRSPFPVKALSSGKQYRETALTKAVLSEIDKSDDDVLEHLSMAKAGAFIGVHRRTASRILRNSDEIDLEPQPMQSVMTLTRDNPVLPTNLAGRYRRLKIDAHSPHDYPDTQKWVDRLFSDPRNYSKVYVCVPRPYRISRASETARQFADMMKGAA